jgi:hypothetical protein
VHLFVQHPFAVACAAVLGVGAHSVLTDGQIAECNAKLSACQAPAPQPPKPIPTVIVTPPPAAPATTPVVVARPLPVDPCADAPVITTADLFVSSGKPFLWKNPGSDPVGNKSVGPLLAQLQFKPSEQARFLEKIAKNDAAVTTFKRGDTLGLMTSGSGKLRHNAKVDFDPTAKTGTMLVYTHQQLVRYNGDCVLREMVLLKPTVCNNWSRQSDRISPVK